MRDVFQTPCPMDMEKMNEPVMPFLPGQEVQGEALSIRQCTMEWFEVWRHADPLLEHGRFANYLGRIACCEECGTTWREGVPGMTEERLIELVRMFRDANP